MFGDGEKWWKKFYIHRHNCSSPPICPVDRDMDCRDIDCVLQTKDVLSYGDYGDKLYPYSGLLCRMIVCLYIYKCTLFGTRDSPSFGNSNIFVQKTA